MQHIFGQCFAISHSFEKSLQSLSNTATWASLKKHHPANVLVVTPQLCYLHELAQYVKKHNVDVAHCVGVNTVVVYLNIFN